MDEKEFFNHLAPTWDANEVLSTPDKIRYVLDFFDLRPGQCVLDLGTGTGVLLPYIAERIGSSGSITAVDYSTGMLKLAKKKFSAISPAPRFLNIDLEQDNIPGEYDRIILYCVYPHLHDPFETLRWLHKVSLKKDGIITIAFPCGPDFINNVHREKHSESDILPPAAELASRIRLYGLDAQVAHADENSYIVNIFKTL